jgi:prenyl protein peptidase
MKRVVLAWYYGLLHYCRHIEPSPKTAFFYCFVLSCLFVGSLYVLVPPKVRRLERDDELQIRWRTFATVAVAMGSILTYPLLFCDLGGAETWSIIAILQPQHVRGVLLHTMLLYSGPMVEAVFRIYDHRQRSIQRGKLPSSSFPGDIFQILLKPSLASAINPVTQTERWCNIRNMVVAPVTEEIVFRGCMVPALLATGMTPLKTALVAPLFFGVAHAHHAILRFRQGERLGRVLIITLFQFTYTSLFGSYAAYALIRTGSVAAVVVSHAYCNWMGLPDMSFLQTRSPLYRHRTVLVAMYVLGAFAFKFGLSTDVLLPLPSVLPSMVRGNIDSVIEEEINAPEEELATQGVLLVVS